MCKAKLNLRQDVIQAVEPIKRNAELRVTPSQLNQKEHGALLCYPGTDLNSFGSRVTQLKKLGVKELILEGDSKIGRYGVLGKGCVSVVVRATLKKETKVVALKIRRVDANRPSMKRDFELQKLANAFGVGPRAISSSQDFFVMEYIDSIKIGKWFEHLKTRSSKIYARKMIRNTLTQCFLLDLNRLDHGELSNPSKHILIKRDSTEPEIVIIDFESASTVRKPANLTAVAQFLFLGGWQAAKMRRILGIDTPDKSGKMRVLNRSKLIDLLREYKDRPSSESFEKILSFVKCEPTKH